MILKINSPLYFLMILSLCCLFIRYLKTLLLIQIIKRLTKPELCVMKWVGFEKNRRRWKNFGKRAIICKLRIVLYVYNKFLC
jgi:hypothetical protein